MHVFSEPRNQLLMLNEKLRMHVICEPWTDYKCIILSLGLIFISLGLIFSLFSLFRCREIRI